MKKRQFTTLLLIWLFSQPLLAAVWSTPHMNVGCGGYKQGDCVLDMTHIGHNMPNNMLNSHETSLPSGMSLMCDHCSTICQPSLVPGQLNILTQATPLVFEAQSITTPADTFLGTLYRPPILS